MNKQQNRSVARCACLLLTMCLAGLVQGQDQLLIETPVQRPEAAKISMDFKPAIDQAGLSTILEPEPVQNSELIDYTVTQAESVLTDEPVEIDGDKITITLDGVSLEDTVKLFMQSSGADILTDPNTLTGRFVSVTFKNVEWIPALKSILEMHGFSLDERTPGSGLFTVQPKKPNEDDPTQIKTFFLDYTTAQEIIQPVTKMLTPDRSDLAALTFDSRNALVVRSTEKNMSEIEKLIGELDRPGKQILVEAKIFELSDQASKQLGIKWDSLESFEIRAGVGPFTESRKSTLSSGRKNSVSRSITDQDNRYFDIDDSPITLVETTETKDADGNEKTTVKEVPTTERTDRFLDLNESANDFVRTISKSQAAILSVAEFGLVLSALERTDGVSVVSNPKMIVTSGSTGAVFKVVDLEPNIRTKTTQGTADSPGDKIEFIVDEDIEIGITLNVTATAKTDDYIEAWINPVLDRQIGNKVVQGNSWPIISSKEIMTTFTLRSGQTVAIGGLTDTEDVKISSKVPLLGSLPVIGRLFSHTEDGKKQVETVIFVTLTLAEPERLEKLSGVPGDARLIQNQMLQEQARIQAQAAEQVFEGDEGEENSRARHRVGPRR